MKLISICNDPTPNVGVATVTVHARTAAAAHTEYMVKEHIAQFLPDNRIIVCLFAVDLLSDHFDVI